MLPPKMMFASGALLTASLIAASAAQAQTVWYANDDGNPNNGCTSWLDACPELQTALSLATDGDQIWVAQGIYKPDYDVNTGQHTGNREATFELIDGVGLYGGFDGTETKLGKRAGLFDDTVLSGNIGNQSSSLDNSYHVVTADQMEGTATLDGFTIKSARANGPGNASTGGGLFCSESNPTITNCVITENSAERGGGVFFGISAAIMTNCSVVANSAEDWGGGLYCWSGSPTIDGCTVAENTAAYGGGFHLTAESSPLIRNCAITANVGEMTVGGILCGTGSPLIQDCTISGNHGSFFAGGLSCGRNTLIVGCVIKDNTVSGSYGTAGNVALSGSATIANCLIMGGNAFLGGGIRHSGSAAIINCKIIGNTASWGAGIYSTSIEAPIVSNSTLWANSAFLRGGGLYCFSGASTLSNSILWNNSAPEGPEIYVAEAATLAVSYVAVQGGAPAVFQEPGATLLWNEGNSDANPLFVDPDGSDGNAGTEDDDLHLSPGSPCIDAAANSAIPEDATTDLDGNPRFIDDPLEPDTGAGDCPIVDMGAYEFQDGTTTCCPADLDDDGAVGAADLAALLGSWGTCEGCPADLDDNGQVGPFDLALLLGAWGECE